MKWIFPLFLLITFEGIADIFAKQWSVDRKTFLAVGALASYLIANTFLLFALKNGSGLGRGAVIFSVVTGVVAVGLGVFFYKENLNKVQMIGLLLGLASIVLLFWTD